MVDKTMMGDKCAELVRAVRSMMAEGLRPGDVTEQSLADHLYTAGQPDPDFLIRTSGEQRLSNYLLYQLSLIHI